ncbi:MAG: hypothetical protein PHC51_07990 [bacterium]|nr:hypothetical protein [bacterium]
MTKSKDKITALIPHPFTEGRIDRLGDLVFATTYRLMPGLTNAITRQIATAIIHRWQKNQTGPHTLLFICNGNICRSAYAQWAAIKLQAEKLFPQTVASTRQSAAGDGRVQLALYSAGLFTSDNKPANPQAISSATKRDINLDEHRTTRFSTMTINDSVLLLPMTLTQYLRIIFANPHRIRHTVCFGLFALNSVKRLSIADPYGHTDDTFQECFARIDEGLEALSRMLH